jgi:hypothetical protein
MAGSIGRIQKIGQYPVREGGMLLFSGGVRRLEWRVQAVREGELR